MFQRAKQEPLKALRRIQHTRLSAGVAVLGNLSIPPAVFFQDPLTLIRKFVINNIGQSYSSSGDTEHSASTPNTCSHRSKKNNLSRA